MSVEKKDAFDIRTRVPRSRDLPADTRALYAQINFMVALLKDIKYEAVYGDLAKLLPKVIANLKKMRPRPDGLDEALEHLDCLQEALAGREPILLRSLWEKQYGQGDFETTHVVPAFRALDALRPGDLCFPFLSVQDGSVRPVGKDDMDEHVNMFKRLTLEDLFRRSKAKNRKLALATFKARRLGILSRPDFVGFPPAAKGGKKPLVRKQPVGFMSSGGNNNRKCVNGKCETVEEPSFCSAADDKTCSVMSD